MLLSERQRDPADRRCEGQQHESDADGTQAVPSIGIIVEIRRARIRR
jgi:hypothetical protein